MATTFQKIACQTLACAPKYIVDTLTNVNPNDDSHNNGSIAWMRTLLKMAEIMRLPKNVRENVIHRYTCTIVYTFMKNLIGKTYTIEYNVDLGEAFNTDLDISCYSLLKNSEEKIFTPMDISNLNMTRISAPVGSYCLCQRKNPVVNDNGEPVTYYLNEEHRSNPNKSPYVRYEYFVDYDKPRVATKFMNGNLSNYDILKGNCISSGMSNQQAEQHIETIIEYTNDISVFNTKEEQSQLKDELLAKWSECPISNRIEKKYITFNTQEMLYYMIQKIDDELIAKCILSAQYILNEYSTQPLETSLQKMYELIENGIPEGITKEKDHSDIFHPEVIKNLDDIIMNHIQTLTTSLDIEKNLEITLDLLKNIENDCPNALITIFTRNIKTEDKVETPSQMEYSQNTNDRKFNSEFYCPITMEIMKDPVFCADGHTYEREAIAHWFVNNNTSPKTNVTLDNKVLTPNFALRSIIKDAVANKN